jgi:hypothetical protein
MTTVTARTERTSRQPTRAAARRRALRASTATTPPSSPPAASTTASATAARARTSTGAGSSSRESIRIGRTSWDSTCLRVRTTADGGLTFRGFDCVLQDSLVLIEACSVLLTCLTREKSSPRVYIHPVIIVFCSWSSCFCFVLICVTGLLTTGAFLSSFRIFIWFCICTNIFRNSIRIRVKMSEKSLMVESKEDEAERLHFQKVTLLQVP